MIINQQTALWEKICAKKAKFRSANVLADIWLPVSLFKLINCGITLCLAFPFLTGRLRARAAPCFMARGKKKKKPFCDTTTNIFREIIFNTVRWKRQYTAAGLFQLFCGISTQFFSVFQNSFHTLCYKSFEKICTKPLWRKKSTKNWQICQLLWENPQKNLFL